MVNYINRHQFEDGLKNATSLYRWTERGALLHAKSLNNDVAWEIYENLVDTYFRSKENISTIKSLEERVVALAQKINNQNKKEIPPQLQTTNILNTFLDGINELISSGEYYLIDIKTATNKESKPKNLLCYLKKPFRNLQSGFLVSLNSFRRNRKESHF